jgi:glucosamine-6-phosphate deaminase
MSVTRRFGALEVRVFDTPALLATAAADDAAAALRAAITQFGRANVMLATGNSQLAFLDELVQRDGIDWSRVVAFHMDEYVGVSAAHPASFERYMRERVADRVPELTFHYLSGDSGDPELAAQGYQELLWAHPLDLCCCGIGENGHLAFNDPSVADFADARDVKVVALEQASRRQQVGEGHFTDVDAVPTHAITVTIPALLRASRVLAIVPEARKAVAVRDALLGPISIECPASKLRDADDATLYLDVDSASLLS